MAKKEKKWREVINSSRKQNISIFYEKPLLSINIQLFLVYIFITTSFPYGF